MGGIVWPAMFDTAFTWLTAKVPAPGVPTCCIGVLCGTLPGGGAVEGADDAGSVWLTKFILSAVTEDGGTLLANEEGTSGGLDVPVGALVLDAVLGAEPGWTDWATLLQLLSTELWTTPET